MQPMIQDPNQAPVKGGDARLAAAIAGQYDFTLKNIFDEAWAKTKGFKTTYWGALGVTVLISILLIMSVMLISTLVGVFTGGIVDGKLILNNPWAEMTGIPIPMLVTMVVLMLLAVVVILPLFAGLWLISINHVAGRPITLKMVFDCFEKPMRFWLASAWSGILFEIPRMLAGPLATYLAVGVGLGVVAYWLCVPLAVAIWLYIFASYYFAMPLLAERKLRTWQALEASRKAVGHHWFKVFSTLLIIVLVSMFIPGVVIGALASAVHKLSVVVGIIFIWLVPFYALCIAIMYREIFGVKPTA